MNIVAEPEDRVDYETTARLATEAFASKVIVRAGNLKWLYERAFSGNTTVIALRDGDRKVGQIAMVGQSLLVNGKQESAAQLVDLFIIPGYRGKQSLRQLYGEVERQFVKEGIRFAIGMPNAKARRVNAHFFNLQPFMTLPISVGVGLWRPASRDVASLHLGSSSKEQILSLFAEFTRSANDNGLLWDEATLFQRLTRHPCDYGVHVHGDLLLISSPRRSRGVSYVLLCGFFVRPGSKITQNDVRAVVSGACQMWRRPLFIYVGTNSRLPALPGLVLPEAVRPSPMLVQLRDFAQEGRAVRLDRYQLIDFDFA